MKKFLYTLGLSLTLIFTISAQAAADKIAVVNVSRIFQQHPQLIIVAKQLEHEFKDRATELQLMEDDLQFKVQRLQRDSSMMKASERSALERSLIVQREAFSNKAQTFEQDNRRRQIEERDKILSRIQKTVQNIASKEGYDVVIDTNAIAYVCNAKDITADVLKQVK